MTKLKTLKDLDKNWIRGDDTLEPEIREFKEQLKAEAVKWVKEMQETLSKGLSIPTPIEVMTEFHNITEEDLK